MCLLFSKAESTDVEAVVVRWLFAGDQSLDRISAQQLGLVSICILLASCT